jgi:CRP/FNR family transcriptional regulator, cyclic AMP receptor protein
LLPAIRGKLAYMAAAAATEDRATTFPTRRTELRLALSELQLGELEHFCKASSRKAGATVFRQDEPAEAWFLLVEGLVELRARPPGRRVYRTVELIQPNCTFGDEALFGEEAYVASARVLEAARVLTCTRSEFEKLTQSRQDIAAGILRVAGSCLIQTIRRSAILAQSPADVGLRVLLSELADSAPGQNGRPRAIRITHAQIAGVLHVSRETVSRMLSELAEEGVVELGRGVIRVQRD